MTRGSARLLCIAVLAGVTATGCSTFTDNSVAARVGDAELSHDDLDRRLEQSGVAESEHGQFSGDVVREEISNWVRRQVAEQVDLFSTYASGEGSMPIACIFVLQVADRAAADAAVARLEGGESWDAVAADVAPQMAESGRQPCGVLDAYIPEIGEQLALLPASGAASVLELDDPPGVFVVRAQTADELDLEDFAFAAGQAQPEALQDWILRLQSADVYVDPRFGVFDGERVSVLPLG